MLLDGGYLNNLPADVMHRLWAGALGRVIACAFCIYSSHIPYNVYCNYDIQCT